MDFSSDIFERGIVGKLIRSAKDASPLVSALHSIGRRRLSAPFGKIKQLLISAAWDFRTKVMFRFRFITMMKTWKVLVQPELQGLRSRPGVSFRCSSCCQAGDPFCLWRVPPPLNARVVTGRRHFCRVCGSPRHKTALWGEPQSSINIQGWKEFMESLVKDLWPGGRSGHEVVVLGRYW